MHTEDGGENWGEQTLPNLTNWYGSTVEAGVIYSVEFANDTLGWLTCSAEGGSGYILLTTDGGETWEQQYVNKNLNEPIYDICAIDENNAWAVGADYIYHNNNADTIIIVGMEDDLQKNNSVKISPNPFINYIQLQITKDYQVTDVVITDITGKTCYQENKIVNNQLNLSHLQQGIYFLTIYFNSNNQINSFTQKIIKL